MPLRTLFTGAALGGLWWLLTNGEPSSWLVGIPSIGLALWLLRAKRAPQQLDLSLTGLLRFIPFFLLESMRGGLDVMRRTLTPKLRIAPGMTQYRIQLQTPPSRLLFINCVSLLPGTLAADLDDQVLQIHMLDRHQDPFTELRKLECAVARVYNQPCPE